MVTQLIYMSEPFGYDDAILTSILANARRRNARDAITGALICRHDIYLQLIEGDGAAIDALYARIAADAAFVDTLHEQAREPPRVVHRREAGREFGAAAQTRPESRFLRRLRRREEPAVRGLRRAGRADRAAVDPGRRDADEEHPVEARVARQDHAVALVERHGRGAHVFQPATPRGIRLAEIGHRGHRVRHAAGPSVGGASLSR